MHTHRLPNLSLLRLSLPYFSLAFLLPAPNTRENLASNNHYLLQCDRVQRILNLGHRGEPVTSNSEICEGMHPNQGDQDSSFIILQNTQRTGSWKWGEHIWLEGKTAFLKKKEGTECSREEQDKLSRVDGYQGLRIWEGVVYAFFGIMCNITHFNQWRQEERGMWKMQERKIICFFPQCSFLDQKDKEKT